MQTILKVLVGSHAHGLALPTSDFDYRGVFVVPTAELLALGDHPPKHTRWIEGTTEDDTSWELAHFLHMATKSNPSILEVFRSPIVEQHELGSSLIELFPYVWSSKAVLDSHLGYSRNQLKKMFDDSAQHVDRRWKYAVAYIRVLMQGTQLLETGDFQVRVEGYWNTLLRAIRAGAMTRGQVIDAAHEWQEQIQQAYKNNPDKKVNLDPVNDYLLRVRKQYFDSEEVIS